jgi:L-ascorbate metabolism protein UlaG (beta-lactamase superfamily)
VLLKTAGPALPSAAIGPVDAVLLSHDQHPDNLDDAGRIFAAAAPLVLTTPEGAARLGGPARGLPAWSSHCLTAADGRVLEVVGAPARHGPDGTEHLTGPVIGFVLRGEGVPTTYVSGDNASLELVDLIAARLGPITTAILFAGAARTPLLGDALLTLSSAMAADAVRRLGAPTTLVVHTDGWAHFTEGADAVEKAFAHAGLLDRLVTTAFGSAVTL